MKNDIMVSSKIYSRFLFIFSILYHSCQSFRSGRNSFLFQKSFSTRSISLSPIVLSSSSSPIPCHFPAINGLRISSNSRLYNLEKNKEQNIYTSSTSSTEEAPILGQVEFKLVSFNILAPCYNKIDATTSTLSRTSGSFSNARLMESEFEEIWSDRMHKICGLLKNTNADIICLQEFWSGSPKLRDIFLKELCNSSVGYSLQELRRTSHWRIRDDGLAIFVKDSKSSKVGRIMVQDSREILFHDCGDRVAQMLLLAIQPPESCSPLKNEVIPYQQFILVNTHLLFPHNKYSSNIRLREVTKILGFVESYRQRELCSTICGRSDVRIPVILTGDFNGSPGGKVCNYLRSQNFRSASEVSNRFRSMNFTENDFEHNGMTRDSNVTAYPGKQGKSWISHRSHLRKYVAVDHTFFLNPSEEIEEKLPKEVPDWTDLVYRELMKRIIDRNGNSSMLDIFSQFDQDRSNYVSRDEFSAALAKFGFTGEGAAALTPEEIEIVIDSADKNDDGQIDYKEFYDRFWQATNDAQQSSGTIAKKKSFFARSQWLSEPLSTLSNSMNMTYNSSSITTNNKLILDTESFRPLGDLFVEDFRIFPQELEHGVWPDDYNLSDHGLVEVIFRGNVLGPEPFENRVNPNPIAQKKLK